MDKKADLAHRINSSYKRMSKGQKLIAEYILNSYDKAAFMTASKLGKMVGVSESTVVRFANVLGYSGYPRLQKSLQEMVRTKLTTVQRIELSSGLDNADILKNVLKADLNNIRLTIEEIDTQAFMNVVDEVLKARTIYVMGLRSAAPMAQFLGYYFNFMFGNVKVVTSGVNDIFEQIIHIGSDDIMIGISFPRYAKRAIEAMKFAKEKGAVTAALTDSLRSPLAAWADHTILARNDMASFVDSLVAPLSVINALVVAAGMRHKSELSVEFLELEKIWDEYNVYVGKDRN